MKKLLVFVLCLGIAGCASSQSIKKLENQGTKQIFTATYEKVWEAAINACNRNSLTIKELDKENGYINADTPYRMESWGEVVGIWIRKIEDSKTQVSVVSRRVGPALLFKYNWEKPVLEGIENYLKLNE